MIQKLYLIHRKGAADFPLKALNSGHWTLWQTCLRKILIGHTDYSKLPKLLEDDTVLKGVEAYRFLLEVASGLHSPMLGETEVFGQFRKVVNDLEATKNPWCREVYKNLHDISCDVKKIRHKFLTKLGSHSYGSLARKSVGQSGEVHFIGAGSFVKDLLPWFLKRNERVVVHCRSPYKAQKLMMQLPGCTKQVEIKKLFETPGWQLSGVVIMAAPVCTFKTKQWLENSSVGKILDLRGESEKHPLNVPIETFTLSSFFQEIAQHKKICLLKVEQAKSYIAHISNKKLLETQFRPYGWEDLCV